MIGLSYLRIKIKGNASDGKHARHEFRRLILAMRRMRGTAITHADPDVRSRIAADIKSTDLKIETISFHRRHLRSETRSCLLVSGFLRGRAYREMERSTRSYPDWGTDGDPDDRGRMTDIVKEYVSEDQHTDVLQKFAQWRDSANADLRLEFQMLAKEAPKPRLRKRRIIDQLVREIAKTQNMSVAAILRSADISLDEWNDLVIGAAQFTARHSNNLGIVLGISPAALENIETVYLSIPPIKTASQRNRERRARREASSSA